MSCLIDMFEETFECLCLRECADGEINDSPDKSTDIFREGCLGAENVCGLHVCKEKLSTDC